MAYTKTTWVNGQAPAISADNLNNIETGLFNQDARITTLENVTTYLVPTAATNGDFKINITNSLATGMVLELNFPDATTASSNARLSIDNGGNYKNIKNNGGTQLLGSQVYGRKVLYYDGTDFIMIKSNTTGDFLQIYVDTNPFLLNTAAGLKVPFSNIYSSKGTSLTFDNANDRITIGKGVSKIKIKGKLNSHYSMIAGQSGAVIKKNGNAIQASLNTIKSNGDYVCMLAEAYTTGNLADYIELFDYTESNRDRYFWGGSLYGAWLIVEVIE